LTRRITKFTIVALILLLSISSNSLNAQKGTVAIKKGNDAYQKGDYNSAITNYNKALEQDPENAIAQFNLGNALQRTNKTEESTRLYEDVVKNSSDPVLQAKANYNNGLSLLEQKKLSEAIEAFKQALRLKSDDSETRENLQKALNELKQKQQKQQPQNNQQKQQPKNPEDKKSRMSRQMMEQKFNELRNQEKKLQKKSQEKNNPLGNQEKDW
jgi:tetratricopeptide (TPR) repeat protein